MGGVCLLPAVQAESEMSGFDFFWGVLPKPPAETVKVVTTKRRPTAPKTPAPPSEQQQPLGQFRSLVDKLNDA